MQFAVCPECRGNGSRVNPAIDGNGITADEFAEMTYDDPEFPEDYFSGVYDVRCQNCNGERVVPECKTDNCSNPVIRVPWDAEDEPQFFTNCEDHLSDKAAKEMKEYYRYAQEMASERSVGA